MLRHLFALLAFLVASLSVAAYGDTVEITKIETRATYGTKINGLALTSARWTGWIDTGIVRAVAFDIAFTDANASVTTVDMVCETSRSATTTNDAGYDLHSQDCAAGACVSYIRSWSYTTAGSKSWTWVVDAIPAPWLNCKLSATGTPAAADVITVYARGLTP